MAAAIDTYDVNKHPLTTGSDELNEFVGVRSSAHYVFPRGSLLGLVRGCSR